MMKNNR